MRNANNKFEDFGERIKKYRVDLKLTQSMLSTKVGVTQSQLSEIESGWHFPKFGVFRNICKELGCKASDVLGF